MNLEKDYNLKSIKEEFKKRGIYYTPPELAEMLRSYLPEQVNEIYDPTCGDGGLLKVFGDEVLKYGQEIHEEQSKIASQVINSTIVCGDTLKDPAFLEKKFDFIIANPPFSIGWEPNHDDERFKDAPTVPSKSKADYAFLLHILYYLSDIGKAVVLQFPGVLYRGQREYQIRKWMVDNNYIEKIIEVEAGYFVDTKISTVIIVFNKNKKSTDIEFGYKSKSLNRMVSTEEIIKNDYNLSVSSYVESKDTREVVDIDELNAEIKTTVAKIDKLRAEIDEIIEVIES